MIKIINKPLLLHLVGYLYYWQMGFNSVFKWLKLEPRLRHFCTHIFQQFWQNHDDCHHRNKDGNKRKYTTNSREKT